MDHWRENYRKGENVFRKNMLFSWFTLFKKVRAISEFIF